MEDQPPSEAEGLKQENGGQEERRGCLPGGPDPTHETKIMGWGMGRVESYEVVSSRQTHCLQAIWRKVLSQ